jgi:hypothetical protein
MSTFLSLLRTEQSQRLNSLIESLNLDSDFEIDEFLNKNSNLKNLIESLSTFNNTKQYYENTFKVSNYILDNLQDCDEYVNLENLEILHSKYPSVNDKRNFNIINSFRPKTESIVYDRLKSITGRLRIEAGPQILTLKKEDRKFIFNDKNLFIIDFRALEPSLLFQLLGFTDLDYNDIYTAIKNHLSLKSIDRDFVKLSVLKILYGSSINHVQELNKSEAEKLQEFLNSTEINDLKKKLNSALYENGQLYNWFGKPLLSREQALESEFQEHMLINYYIQSSATDLALLLLSDFFKTYKNDIIPFFVIHDALVFYAKPSFNRSEKILKFDYKNFNFFSKISHISE